MKRLLAIVALGVLVIGATASPAHASAAVNAALALGAFAVFNQLFLLPALVRPVYAAPAPVVFSAPPAVVASAPATFASTTVASAPAPPAPAIRREVVYPNGRHVLLGDGVTVAYQWVWVPNPPAGAPPPPPPR